MHIEWLNSNHVNMISCICGETKCVPNVISIKLFFLAFSFIVSLHYVNGRERRMTKNSRKKLLRLRRCDLEVEF